MPFNERLDSIVDLQAIEVEYTKLTAVIKSITGDISTLSKEARNTFNGFGSGLNLQQVVTQSAAAAKQIHDVASATLDYKKIVNETNGFLATHTGTMGENIKQYIAYKNRLSEITKELKSYKDAGITTGTQIENLVREQTRLKISLSETTTAMKAQEKETIAAAGSIDDMAQRLGRLKDAYRQLSKEDRESDLGKSVIKQIDELDKAVKEADASIGNFQRNVGNYPDAKKELKAIHEQIVQLIIDGKKGSEEFTQLTTKAQNLQSAISTAGGLTSFSGGMGTTSASAELSQVTQQMHRLVLEEKQGTKEFDELKKRAHELKAAMGEVKLAVDKNTESVGGVSTKLKDLARNVVAMAASYVSFQALQSIAADIVEEVSQADKNTKELTASLERIGNVQALGRLSNQADELAAKFKYLDNDAVIKVFDNLITYGKLTEDQMNELLPVIVDFAAKEGTSIEDASETIIKALEGNGKALKQYGIDIKDAEENANGLVTPTERLSILMKELKPRIEGSAEAFGTTLTGKIAIMKQMFADVEESIGRFVIELSGVDKAQQAAAVSAKKEADASQLLVDEYEQLSGKVNKTEADKKQLEKITGQLGATFGQSVIEIDKETGAMSLNIEATKEMIKQRLLLSNARASELALKYNAQIENQTEATKQLTVAQRLYDDAVKATGITEEKINAKLTRGELGTSFDALTDTEKKVSKLSDAVNLYKGTASGASVEAEKLMKQLKELGFNAEDVAKLFNPKPITPTNTGAKAAGPATGGGAKDRLKNEMEVTKLLYEEYAKQVEIDAEAQKAISENESNSMEQRLAAYKKYSELSSIAQQARMSAEYDNANYGLKEIAKIEKKAVKDRTDEEKSLVEKKALYQQQILTIVAKNNAQIFSNSRDTEKGITAIQADEVQKRLDMVQNITTNMEGLQGDALNKIEEKYKAGTISYKELTKQKEETERKFQLGRLLMTKEYLQAELEALVAADPTTNVNKITEAIAKIDSQLKNMGVDKPGSMAFGLSQEDVSQIGQLSEKAVEGINVINSAIQDRYQRELELMEQKKTAIDEIAQKEIEAVNNSFLNQEQKTIRIGEIEAKAAQQRDEINRKENDIKRKAAIADKAATIAAIIQRTALAVITALGMVPFTPFNIALAASIGAIGAMQLGIAAAQPIPSYAEGTEDHPGGAARFGEAGPEVVIEPGKKPYLVDKETIANLPEHTQVLPVSDIVGSASGLMGAILIRGLANGSIVVASDSAPVVASINSLKSEITEVKSAIMGKREVHFSWKNGELRKAVNNNGSWAQYLNDI